MRALLMVLCCASVASAQTSPGIVGEVRVHGNHTTPDADVLAIVGEIVGKPATDALHRRGHLKGWRKAGASTASRSASDSDRSTTRTTSC